jgi:hypothetical protein
VVAYLSADVKQIYGYQLKDGRVIPKKNSSSYSQHSYVIRSYSREEKLLHGWKEANDDEIDQFLGVAGSCLAPKHWRSLDASEN